jgi:hypothetical protein
VVAHSLSARPPRALHFLLFGALHFLLFGALHFLLFASGPARFAVFVVGVTVLKRIASRPCRALIKEEEK